MEQSTYKWSLDRKCMHLLEVNGNACYLISKDDVDKPKSRLFNIYMFNRHRGVWSKIDSMNGLLPAKRFVYSVACDLYNNGFEMREEAFTCA